MLQITRASTEEHFQHVCQLRAEMGRWDAAQAQRLGLDPQEVLAFFYSVDDQTAFCENAPPHGDLLLAMYAGKESGCAAFRRIDEVTCELHHVYVREQFRGLRIGRAMVEQLIVAARGAGYKVMCLETTTFMKEAQALYESIGFKSRGPYYEVPKIFEPFTVFLELRLDLSYFPQSPSAPLAPRAHRSAPRA